MVIDVLNDRKKKPLKDWLKRNKNELSEVRSISMDRWEPFINAVREVVEEAEGNICFDRFHVASHFGKALLGWMARCRLDPIIKVGRMVRRYLWGILNAIMHRVTNAIAESINATIQKIKARACGFRSRARFRTAILFHKGGLSMLPSGALSF